jgi:ketosteroid isomerase-like protein
VAETADLVRTILEAWNRRDMDAITPYLHADFEWVEHDAGLESVPVRRGASALDEVTAGLDENLADYRAEVVDVVEIEAGRAIAVTRESGQGATSGAGFSTEFGYVLTLRDGKVVRIEAYRDPRDAFGAVGQTDRFGA